jgi:hypothetical protein
MQPENRVKLVAILGTLLMCFGIIDVNTEDYSFDANKLSYIFITLGAFLLLMVFWSRHKK